MGGETEELANIAKRIIGDHLLEIRRRGVMLNTILSTEYWENVFRKADSSGFSAEKLLRAAYSNLQLALKAGMAPYNRGETLTAVQFAELALGALGIEYDKRIFGEEEKAQSRKIIQEHLLEIYRKGKMMNTIAQFDYWRNVFERAGHGDLFYESLDYIRKALDAGLAPYNRGESVTAKQFARLALRALGFDPPLDESENGNGGRANHGTFNAQESESYYQILGVLVSATEPDIKNAYRRLAMKFHPDRNIGNEAAVEEQFKRIKNAYEILIDPQKRAAYDKFSRENSSKANGRTFHAHWVPTLLAVIISIHLAIIYIPGFGFTLATQIDQLILLAHQIGGWRGALGIAGVIGGWWILGHNRSVGDSPSVAILKRQAHDDAEFLAGPIGDWVLRHDPQALLNENLQPETILETLGGKQPSSERPFISALRRAMTERDHNYRTAFQEAFKTATGISEKTVFVLAVNDSDDISALRLAVEESQNTLETVRHLSGLRLPKVFLPTSSATGEMIDDALKADATLKSQFSEESNLILAEPDFSDQATISELATALGKVALRLGIPQMAMALVPETKINPDNLADGELDNPLEGFDEKVRIMSNQSQRRKYLSQLAKDMQNVLKLMAVIAKMA